MYVSLSRHAGTEEGLCKVSQMHCKVSVLFSFLFGSGWVVLQSVIGGEVVLQSVIGGEVVLQSVIGGEVVLQSEIGRAHV